MFHALPAEVPWVRLDVVRGLHQPTCQAAVVRIALTCVSQDSLDAVRTVPSALKHGITEVEVRTALEVPMRHVWQGENLLLVIGADSTARLLEVVDPETGDERVIHAMSLRRSSTATCEVTPMTKKNEAELLSRAEAWLDALDPATTAAEDPRELRRIGLAKRDIAAAEDELRHAVHDARAAGHPWSAIGRTVGVSKQAAQERFRATAPA